MLTFIQSDKTTKYETIKVWLDYKQVIYMLQTWAEGNEPFSSLPWVDENDGDWDWHDEGEMQHAHERTALLGLAFHPRVISREEEIESDRRAVWADEEVDETEFNRREKADERTANAKQDRIHRRKHAMGLVFA